MSSSATVAHQHNVRNCTGPRTVEGKERSRFNAVKHGMTTDSILPGEDPVAYQERVDVIAASFEPRTEFEEALVGKAALYSWKLDRANRVETARLTRTILTDAAARARREEDEADALGARLFFDRRGAEANYATKDFMPSQPMTSWSGIADDPDRPSRLVRKLESTGAGCRWLLARWAELRSLLDTGGCWLSPEKFKSVRLLGKQPLEADADREVALVFLASHTIKRQHKNAFAELNCEMNADVFGQFEARLRARGVEEMRPKSGAEARKLLLRIVDRETGRLNKLAAEHQALEDRLAPLQTAILSFDPSMEADRLRRHELNCDRLMHRNLDAIGKGRRDLAAGWGRTKYERERRKEERRSTGEGDERLVMDEYGTVRNAKDYKGNLEEGLARFETRFGGQLDDLGNSPGRVEGNYVSAVPDFARWNAPVADRGLPGDAGPVVISGHGGGECVEDQGGSLSQGICSGARFRERGRGRRAQRRRSVSAYRDSNKGKLTKRTQASSEFRGVGATHGQESFAGRWVAPTLQGSPAFDFGAKTELCAAMVGAVGNETSCELGEFGIGDTPTTSAETDVLPRVEDRIGHLTGVQVDPGPLAYGETEDSETRESNCESGRLQSESESADPNSEIETPKSAARVGRKVVRGQHSKRDKRRKKREMEQTLAANLKLAGLPSPERLRRDAWMLPSSTEFLLEYHQRSP